MATEQTPEKSNDDALKARNRKRSIALAIALGAIAVVFYAMTIVKMGPGLFDRSL